MKPGGVHDRRGDLRRVREFFGLIVGGDDDGYIELRFRSPDGRVHQEFFAVSELDRTAQRAQDTGQFFDVWVGMAPRVRRGGKAQDVAHGWVLSADCDDDRALDALARFEPKPTAVVASGSPTPTGRKAHAHWTLREPLACAELVAAKRVLAQALGSDDVSDAPRVMRVPGTTNFKEPEHPRPVELLSWAPERRYRVEEIVSELRAPTPAPRVHLVATAERVPGRGIHLTRRDETTGAIVDARTGECLGADPLLAIPPEVYVERLLGVTVSPSGKVSCPFPHAKHGQDRTPSLHVYPERGWYCFGCRRGGTVIDLGAYIAEVEPPLSRRAFRKLCDRLRELFAAELAG